MVSRGARIHDVSHAAATRVRELCQMVLIAKDQTTLPILQNSSIEKDMRQIISTIRSRNSEAIIVFTGAGSMGTIKRFIQPTKWLLGLQSQRVNNLMESVSREEGVVFAHIARETGRQFAENPTLFAEDNYHPSDTDMKFGQR